MTKEMESVVLECNNLVCRHQWKEMVEKEKLSGSRFIGLLFCPLCNNYSSPIVIKNENLSCYLCGKVEGEKVFELRPVRISNNGHFWDGYYRPRLSPEERWLLKDNKEHYICVKRQACKNRRHRKGLK